MQNTLPISKLKPNRNNPRTFISPRKLAWLVDSIKSQGVLQPLLVRPMEDADGIFEVIAGSRRLRAAQEAGLEDVPVYIKTATDDQAEEMAAAENTGRTSMGVIAEAVVAQRILLRNDGDKDDTAKALGWSVDTLRSRLALLALVPEARQALDEERLKVGHAELLATLAPDKQLKVLAGLLEHKVSVAELEKQLASFAQKLADAPFDTAQCSDCKHNSSFQRGLFETHVADGFCTHPDHYRELIDQWLNEKAAPLREEYRVVRIYKAGDGFEPLPLRADGRLGVGEEQAQACTSCDNFGVGVSGVAGSFGEVSQPNCFDATCNATKVAARLAKETSAAAAAKEASSGAAGVATAGHASSKGKALPSTHGSRHSSAHSAGKAPAALSSGVRAYVLSQWRRMCATELQMRHDMGQRLMLALVASQHARDLDGDWFAEQVDALVKKWGGATTLDAALGKSMGVDEQALQDVLRLIPASAAWKLEESQLNHLLNWLAVDETSHFQVNTDFLTLLTKAEIESVASEIGLSKYLGDAFKKLRDGKKDDFIKGLLGATGFEFKGKVPGMLRYKRNAVRQ